MYIPEKKNEKHDFEAKVMSRFGEKIIFPFFLRGDFQVNQDVNLPVETWDCNDFVEHIWRKTRGAFDVSLHILLWKRMEKSQASKLENRPEDLEYG